MLLYSRFGSACFHLWLGCFLHRNICMWCRNSRKVRYLLILKMWSTQVIDESSSTKLCVSIRQVLSRRRKREGGRRVNTRSFMYNETTDMPRLKWPSNTQESTLYDVAMQWARHSTDGFLSEVQICLGCALDCTAGCISRWPASNNQLLPNKWFNTLRSLVNHPWPGCICDLFRACLYK